MVHEAYSTAAGLVLKRSCRSLQKWCMGQSTAAGMQVVLFIIPVQYCMHSAHMHRCTAFIQLYYHVPLPRKIPSVGRDIEVAFNYFFMTDLCDPSLENFAHARNILYSYDIIFKCLKISIK
jgi:hypothetical protein